MTRREIAALCCRILAIVVLAWAAMYFVNTVSLLGSAFANSSRFGGVDNPYFDGAKTSGSVGCLLLLFAMTLGWKAELVARWMATDDPEPVSGPEMSADALLPVACTGVGLFAVTRALPTFFRLAAIVATNQSTVGEIWGDDDWKISLLADGLLLAWGVWLVFGNRGLIRIVRWARSARKAPQRENSAEFPPAVSAGESHAELTRR